MIKQRAIRRKVPRRDRRAVEEGAILADDLPAPSDDAIAGDGIDAMVEVAHRRMARALRRFRRPAVRAGITDSPLGRLLVAEGPRGLLAVAYLDTPGAAPVLEALRAGYDVIEDPAVAVRVREEIDRLLAGDSAPIVDHPVDLSLAAGDFQRRALAHLRRVPPGAVVTYQGLAEAIGAPSGQRAIGNSMASNPLPVYVPCHRVIRSDGAIGNYGGGVERKLSLLRAEGFQIGPDQRLPPQAVWGHRRSNIFCRPGCAAVRRASRPRWMIFADAEHACGAGMRPCKLCAPA